MSQTAIDLLFEQFDVFNSDSSIPVSVVLTPQDWLKLYLKFKSMEKEQIVNTYKHGQNNGYMYKDVGNDIIDAEQYYNQTYFQNGNNL